MLQMLRKITACLLLLLCSGKYSAAIAQADVVLTGKNFIYVDTFSLLPDNGYTFQQIQHDSSLPFRQQDTLQPFGYKAYWVKLVVKNPSAYDQLYYLSVRPQLDYILYYQNEETQAWQSKRAGTLVVTDSNPSAKMPHLFKGGKQALIYLYITTGALSKSRYPLVTNFYLQKGASFEKALRSRYNIWLATMLVILVFFCYNAYLYFMFRDRTYLYYLLTLIGGMLYITGSNSFFGELISFRFANCVGMSTGNYFLYTFDSIMQEIGVLVVITGVVQFARYYLQTEAALPVWDRILKYSLLLYTSFIGICIVFFTFSWLPFRYFYIDIMNYGALVIIIAMLVAGVLQYRQSFKPATYFLIAQTLPLLLVIAVSIHHIIIEDGDYTVFTAFIPAAAIITHALTFAVALVARVNLLKNNLRNKEIEAQTLQNEQAQQLLKTQALEEKIRHDEKELAQAELLKALMVELHHRVKNNLQIVSSLLSLQSFRITDKVAAAAVREGQHRIEAMSLIHQRLYTHDNITEINIKDFITDLSESLMQAYGYQRNDFELVLDISSEMMDVDKAIPLGLIINELVTNAFKYAYNGVKKPALHITMTKESNQLKLNIADNGKGMDLEQWEDAEGSYGKELVKTFTQQLNGSLSIAVSGGTLFTIIIPYHLQQHN